MKLTVDQQRELIPDDAIHQAFLGREDISILPPDEQEKRWQEALININKFRERLAALDSHIIWADNKPLDLSD